MEPAKKPNRQWLSLGVVLLVTAAALYLVLIGTRPARPPVAPPQTSLPQAGPTEIAPGALYAVSYPGLDDQMHALGKWQGKVIVLNFWATWCVPCLEEMPIFERVHKKFTEKGVVFVGLAADDKSKVTSFLQANPVSYPILIGDFEALEVARRLGNRQAVLPYTAIVDRNGKVVHSKVGAFTEAELEAKVSAAL